MSPFGYYKNLTEFTGKRKTNFQAMVSTAKHLAGYFNGNLCYNQVQNVTPGKVYTIILVEGFGDVSDWSFIDDAGKVHILGSFFLVQP